MLVQNDFQPHPINPEGGIIETQLTKILTSKEDFRLFLELYAQADCLITHGGYLRALAKDNPIGMFQFESHTQTCDSYNGGYVQLSIDGSVLKHSIIKTITDTYSERLYLQIYANANPDYTFTQFYGKNYQNVSMRFRIRDTDGTGSSQFQWVGDLRWLTTDSSENEVWSTGTSVTNRWASVNAPDDYTVSSFDTLSDNWQTINFDLSGVNKWDNRIITALRFELFTASDASGTMQIDTDIDWIKISAKTS